MTFTHEFIIQALTKLCMHLIRYALEAWCCQLSVVKKPFKLGNRHQALVGKLNATKHNVLM